LLSLLLLTFGTAITADAQQGTGNIIGTVKDSTGATVEGATVDIQNVDTQNKFTLSTNDAGFYNSPPLLPSSNYSVIVTRQGFQTSVTKGVTLTVGARVEVDV